jgi:hypothetical protein
VFEREIYGRRPANIPKVSWQVVNTFARDQWLRCDRDPGNCSARVDNSAYQAISVNIQAILTLPASWFASAVPVIIQFGGGTFDLPANVSTSANPCPASGCGPWCPSAPRLRPLRERRKSSPGSSRSCRAGGAT